MPLPNGVSVSTGRLEFVSQRGYYAPPYVSCMFAAVCSVLVWMGYRLPLHRKAEEVPPENFVWTMHKQSGAPLDSGSSVRHTKNAMGRLLPDAPMYYGAATSAEIIDLLAANAGIRVSGRCANLPQYLRKWTGDYNAGHAFSMIGTRMNGSVREVFWMDPMGKPWLYSGQWIPWDDVKNVLSKNASGETIITWGYKNTAVNPDSDPTPEPPVEPDPTPEPEPEIEPIEEEEPEVIPDPVEEEGETVGSLTGIQSRHRGIVAAGTTVLHPVTLARLYTLSTDTTVRIYGLTADGLYRGVVARTAGTEGTNPKVLLVPAESVSGLYTAP